MQYCSLLSALSTWQRVIGCLLRPGVFSTFASMACVILTTTVCWAYQPGSHRRKFTQDFSSTFLLRHRYDYYKEGRSATCKPVEEDVATEYSVGRVLGEGSFAVVKEGIHKKTQTKAALKHIDRSKLSDRDERFILTEAGIMQGLEHAHVVEMLGFFKWDDSYCLALEHMAGGELCQDIMRRVFYSEACARRIILQVLDALAFLHRRGIVHRDVKPENLLLPKPGGEIVKLSDFGLATVLHPPYFKVVEPVGSPGYAAPELLRVTPYDCQADMFSLGVIAFVLLSGYLPFRGSSMPEIVKATLAGEPSFDDVQWSATTGDAKSFVQSLLNPCPDDRPTAEGAISHPWMKIKGRVLLKRPLSDQRSGRPKSLLEDYLASRKRKLKAAVSAVLATNRLQHFLIASKDPGNNVDNGTPMNRSKEETCEGIQGIDNG